MMCSRFWFGLVLTVTSACVVEHDGAPDSEATVDEESIAPRSRLVQRGAVLQLLEVTDDDHAIYQDGQQIYATALDGDAERQLIAEVPAGNTGFVYRVGKVAFVWTNPDRTSPSFGVSPLVIWSAATGPRLASPASPVGTLATSASPDGRSVVFPSNSSPDGSTGDLELASTDLSERTTLVANVQMAFATGPCRPFVSFVGRTHHAIPVAAYCEGASPNATIARWIDGELHTLISNGAVPQALSVHHDSGRVFSVLAGSRHPVVIDRDGTIDVLAEVSSLSGFLGIRGDAFFTTATATPSRAELHRVGRSGTPAKLLELARFIAVSFGSRSFAEPPTSRDGRSILTSSATVVDQATGATLGDVQLSDTRGRAETVALDDHLVSLGFLGNPFTSDSSHALFDRFDPTTFLAEFVVATRDERRTYSLDGQGWASAIGSIVSFNEHPVVDPNTGQVLADLKSFDACSEAEPRLIAPRANATYFLSHHKTGVVYTTDVDPQTSGLYVARVF